MHKVLHFIRRKDHLTHAEFRDHFERSHAAMAVKYCGHLYTEYRRNYIEEVWSGGDSRDAGSGYGRQAANWDLISEWILPDAGSLQEIYRIMQQPGIDELFRADEDRIIDRTATMTIVCEVRDTGTAFDPRGTVFDTPSGEPAWD